MACTPPAKPPVMLFHTPQVDVRGSCVAMREYAAAVQSHRYRGQRITAWVLAPAAVTTHERDALFHLRRAFPVLLYDKLRREVCRIADTHTVLGVHCISYGTPDSGPIDPVEELYGLPDVHVGVHAVFDMSTPHGHAFVGVSEALARRFDREGAYVPHIAPLLPTPHSGGRSLRDALHIPASARVVGRHGGWDTFNLWFVWNALSHALRQQPDLWLLFVGTPPGICHPRALFLPPLTDAGEKARFIDACDAHLEGGNLGHTFGLAIAEFVGRGRPALVYDGQELWNRAHLDILRDSPYAVRYGNADDLVRACAAVRPLHLLTPPRHHPYSPFTAGRVMPRFLDTFTHPTHRPHV